VTVKVDPAALRGYAGQLERNAEAFAALDKYCERYCDDAGGLTGLLWATAVPATNLAAEMLYGLLRSAKENLSDTGLNLEAAATRYESNDEAAAERIWTTRPRWSTPPNQWVANDTSHVGDFNDPAAVNPSPPAKNKDMEKKIEKTFDTISEIDQWLEKVLSFSLRKELFPWLTGDWGKVREMAEAYGALGGGAGVLAVDTNIQYGMKSLSSLWDGSAAEAFEYHIGSRWHDALEAVSDQCSAAKEGMEALAAQAEHLYLGLDSALTAFLLWVVSKVVKAIRLAMSVVGLGKAAHIIEEIWHGLETLFELVKTWTKIWPETVKHVMELLQAEYAMAKAAFSAFSGDLGAVQSG
jgi:hypothetical protein